MKKEEGLTLIELVTVLAILSVIVLIVIPSSNFFDTTRSNVRLTLIAHEVVNDLRYIQQKSIFEGEILYFKSKSDNTGYYINRYNDNKNIKTKNLPKGIKISKKDGGKVEIYFNQMGTPIGACTITLKNDKGSEIYISVAVVTGRIMISGKNY
ncbi:prepilin-type N-terminal cleavage/methylation domain-containing protein [Thermoanaerobacter thermocopriae]|uniref:prepilin-type N-terminal cleavage/methylation domain-containing protein n=1 Tax=Thermoanaerobacter thermocopriae TaxID=29350 RepID=UPI00048D8225|nr:prepilin-type N-terminal cleavage/methylation domain-containing protein [Thermoanaerobacter thermocopriae]